MAQTIQLDPNTVAVLQALTVDDGAKIKVDGVEKAQVHFGQSGSCNVTMKKGQIFTIHFELQNMTGGAYHGNFQIQGHQGGKALTVYSHAPMGEGGPTPVVWQETVNLMS
jgi:hypothetical protein